MEKNNHIVEILFALGLFFALCLCGVTVISLGAAGYKKTTAAMEKNFTQYTGLEYIAEKARQNDTEGGISADYIENQKALRLRDVADDTVIYTYIYYYEGYLRELNIVQNASPLLSAGQKILKISDFSIEENEGLFTVCLTDSEGNTDAVILSAVSERTAEQ